MDTVTSGVIASFAIGDMLMHNRRKRSEWLADQQSKHKAKLDDVRSILASGGTIDEDQRLLLNQERVQMEAAQLQKNKKGMFTKAKEAIFASVPEEEIKGGVLGAAKEKDGSGVLRAVEEKVQEGARKAQDGYETVQQKAQQSYKAAEQKAQDSYKVAEQKAQQGYRVAEQKAQQGYSAVESTAADIERRAEVMFAGGPLDREAQASADALKRTSKSWTSWLTGR